MGLAPAPDEGGRVVVLSGAGLSKASGIPTFRDEDGLWRGRVMEQLATPEAWFADREIVRTFYDERRVNCATVLPNEGHDALARLQQRWGIDRVSLVTQNIDGLLQKAGAPDVIEMHGSLWQLQCERDEGHPNIQVAGAQPRTTQCAICKALLRPAVVWFGEVPRQMDRIVHALRQCKVFVSVGTSGVVYPAAGLVEIARQVGATCIEVNPKPSGARFDIVLSDPAEESLPELVGTWLNEHDDD